jgi:OOP family OmpA-OmpF porin
VNDGWAAFARLGYRFNPNWRVELEGGYRSGRRRHGPRRLGHPNGVCNLTPATGPCYSPDGDIESTTLMANVIYDFGWEAWGIRPFVGLGAGVNHVNTDVIGRLRNNRAVGFGADDSSTKFAAQAIAGLAWAISDRANIDLTYRYLTGDAEFASTSPRWRPTPNQGTFEGDYDNSHTVTLGLRYAFGAEPAPPPPPPPPYVPPPPPPVLLRPRRRRRRLRSGRAGRSPVRRLLRLGSFGPDGRSPFGHHASRQLRQVGSSDPHPGRRSRRHLGFRGVQHRPVEPPRPHHG